MRPRIFLEMFNLAKKRALILGAGSGIGRAAALALAAQEAEVVVSGRRPAPLESVRDEIAAQNGAAKSAPCDIARPESFEKLLSAEGPFHIVVNSAGMAMHQPVGEITAEAVDAVLTLNLRAALLCAQSAAQMMRKAGVAGSIINVSSQMGHVGGKKRMTYCASKHAVEGMTKAAALDLAADGIRINTVCPTFVLTPMTEGFLNEPDFLRDVLASIPLGRLATPEDIAGAIVFLASDASAMTTGSAVMVDGGWTAR